MYWYSKAAEQGLADAQNNLGACYYKGLGVKRSHTKAIGLFCKAAKQGNEIAIDNLNNLGYSWLLKLGHKKPIAEA